MERPPGAATEILRFDFMLSLNLLSPGGKEAIGYTLRGRAAAALGGGLAAIVFIFAVLLLPSVFFLVFQADELAKTVGREAEAQRHEVFVEVAKLAQASRLGGAVIRHERERLGVYPLFVSVFGDVPSGVSLSRIRLESSDRKLAIEGFAQTRSSLLEFLEHLGSNPKIASVSSPVGNLIRETNIQFSVAIGVK